MKYHYSKSKFTNQLFYKKIDSAVVENIDGVFRVSIYPFFNFSGNYHIHSAIQKDSNRTVFLTMKSQDDQVDFENLGFYNKFFISLSHDGRKFMIFTEDTDGVILKS